VSFGRKDATLRSRALVQFGLRTRVVVGRLISLTTTTLCLRSGNPIGPRPRARSSASPLLRYILLRAAGHEGACGRPGDRCGDREHPGPALAQNGCQGDAATCAHRSPGQPAPCSTGRRTQDFSRTQQSYV